QCVGRVEDDARNRPVRLVELILFGLPLGMFGHPALQPRSDLLDHAFFPGLRSCCGSNACFTARCSSWALIPVAARATERTVRSGRREDAWSADRTVRFGRSRSRPPELDATARELVRDLLPDQEN